eukprot:478140-Pleurochrysis_carterae.AAC.1
MMRADALPPPHRRRRRGDGQVPHQRRQRQAGAQRDGGARVRTVTRAHIKTFGSYRKGCAMVMLQLGRARSRPVTQLCQQTTSAEILYGAAKSGSRLPAFASLRCGCSDKARSSSPASSVQLLEKPLANLLPNSNTAAAQLILRSELHVFWRVAGRGEVPRDLAGRYDAAIDDYVRHEQSRISEIEMLADRQAATEAMLTSVAQTRSLLADFFCSVQLFQSALSFEARAQKHFDQRCAAHAVREYMDACIDTV